MSRGDAESAAKHQHGVQAREAGTTGSPVTEARFAALEARIETLEKYVAQLEADRAAKKPEKKDKAA